MGKIVLSFQSFDSARHEQVAWRTLRAYGAAGRCTSEDAVGEQEYDCRSGKDDNLEKLVHVPTHADLCTPSFELVQLTASSTGCMLCEFVTTELFNWMSLNTTAPEIEKFLDNECMKLSFPLNYEVR